jgi:NAD(P)-dependent dehydrogenase (short-subunit alcohol dehydrogenase family)
MTECPRVFVTGARRGIGRGIAYEFAAKGYDVVINDAIEDEAAQATLAGLRERGAKAAFVKGNIAELANLPGIVESAYAAFGGLDVLVNNAGITSRMRGDMLELTPESFDSVMGVNLRGTFFLTQAIARRMLDAGAAAHPRSIISISSSNAALVGPDRADYCLSKTAVSMMTKLFAVRLGEANIGVFEIRPGIIRTDMTAAAKEKYDKAIAAGLTPTRRWGEPLDIGRVAVALASGDFHFSTGDAFNVDGGLHIHHL